MCFFIWNWRSSESLYWYTQSSLYSINIILFVILTFFDVTSMTFTQHLNQWLPVGVWYLNYDHFFDNIPLSSLRILHSSPSGRPQQFLSVVHAFLRARTGSNSVLGTTLAAWVVRIVCYFGALCRPSTISALALCLANLIWPYWIFRAPISARPNIFILSTCTMR